MKFIVTTQNLNYAINSIIQNLNQITTEIDKDSEISKNNGGTRKIKLCSKKIKKTQEGKCQLTGK